MTKYDHPKCFPILPFMSQFPMRQAHPCGHIEAGFVKRGRLKVGDVCKNKILSFWLYRQVFVPLHFKRIAIR